MHRYGWLEKGRRAGIFKLLVEGRDPSSQDSPASSLPVPFCLALKDERFQLEEFSPPPRADPALRCPPGRRGGLLLPALHGGHPPPDCHAHCIG